MKKILSSLFIIGLLAGLGHFVRADDLGQRLTGRILLQVEDRGEAWYVNPANFRRYYLGRPADALAVMAGQGVGITNRNLHRIPVGLEYLAGSDSDGDGLPDELEKALGANPELSDSDGDGFGDRPELEKGYDPAGAGQLAWDNNFAKTQAGRILLQAEGRGEAWYINPLDLRRYFLGRPADALALMRAFGLGITTKNLEIITAMSPSLDPDNLEHLIYGLINAERQNQGQEILKWNSELAAVAREHSRDLARENESLTGLDRSCNYALIHHEGLNFGAYNQDRLGNRGVYYFGRSGENIALEPAGTAYVFYPSAEAGARLAANCQAQQQSLEAGFKNELAAEADGAKKTALVKAELARRQEKFQATQKLEIDTIKWSGAEEIARVTVQGWLGSPGHRENILTAEYDETGVGIAYVNGHIIATQIFIQRAYCGYNSGPCCEKTGYYPYCFTPLICEQMVCRQD